MENVLADIFVHLELRLHPEMGFATVDTIVQWVKVFLIHLEKNAVWERNARPDLVNLRLVFVVLLVLH